MDPNLQQPDEPTDRVITLRLTRDTLILAAALAFLGFAIVLAVLFPPTGTSPRPEPPAATNPPTQPAIAVETPADASTLTPAAIAPTGAPTEPVEPTSGEYPAPSEGEVEPTLVVETAVGTTPAAIASGATSLPTAGVSTFAPGRTTPGSPNLQVTLPPTAPANAVVPTIPIFPTASPQASPETSPDAQPTAGDEPTAAQPPPPVLQPTVPAVQPTQPAAQPPVAPQPTRRPPPPTATPVRADLLRGNVRWTIDRSPIRLTRDQRLARGASLIIDPGVELQLAPGVAIYVEGTLTAFGQPGQPVRLNSAGGPRWDGIYGLAGSTIILEHVEIRGGGSGGTLLASDGGRLALRNTRATDNGGHIRASSREVEVRDSEISGNDMPYGAAVDIALGAGGNVALTGNRIGGNRMATGAPQVQIASSSAADATDIDLQRNLLIGQDGPNVVLATNGPMRGNLICNALLNGSNGLSLKSQSPVIPGLALTIRQNVIDDHTPPIIPIYLRYGIGRGATSDLAIDMRENWWGTEIGPYHPEEYADGRGDSVGANILFQPWLTARPGCAPAP